MGFKRFFLITALFYSFFAVQAPYAEALLVRFGYNAGYNIVNDPYSLSSKGIAYDLLSQVGRQAGFDLEFIDIVGSLGAAVSEGEVDVAGLLTRTSKIPKDVVFSKLNFGYAQFGLAVKNNVSAYYDDPESIDGKTVATFYDHHANELFDNYLKRNNISAKMVYGSIDDYTSLDADYYLVFSSMRSLDDYKLVMRFEKQPLFLISSSRYEPLIRQLEDTFTQLLSNNPTFTQTLQNEYAKLDRAFINRPLRKSEAELLLGKTFSVGYIENHKPFQYTNELGEPAGINVESLNLLAEEYGFFVEYFPYNTQNKNLNKNEAYDMLISLTGEPQHDYQFYKSTIPYFSTELVLLINKEHSTNLNGVENVLNRDSKIGMLNLLGINHSYLYSTLPNAEFVIFDSVEDIITALENESIDSAMLSSSVAEYVTLAIQKDVYFQALDLELPMGLYLSNKLSDTYIDIFNTIFTFSDQRRFYEIYFRNAASFVPEYSASDFFAENAIFLFFVIFTVTSLAGIYITKVQIDKRRATQKLLRTDTLTGVMSLDYFTSKVDALLESAKVHEYEVITIDIDYFRMINSTFGLKIGTDIILIMSKALRKAYEDPDVLITRKHAEEFIIFKKIDHARKTDYVLSEFLVPAIKSIVGKSYALSMSIGVYPIVNLRETISEMIDFAEIARKRGKRLHKMTIITFTEDMRKKYNDTFRVVNRMKSALDNHEFKVYYQPKVDFKTLKINGAEALVRWHLDTGEQIFPDVFISTMENTGFIAELDLYVVEEVCKYISEHSHELAIPRIAVNFSAVTISDEAVLEKLLKIIKKYSIQPFQIEIEVTESALNSLEDTLMVRVEVLKQLGFKVAMDDFGTGESSLTRLSVCNVDILKLDKSFLDFNQNSRRGAIVIQKMISLAKELNMKIVSEGVETLEQVHMLRTMECDTAQGYYFSRPISADDFTALLKQNRTYTLFEG